MTTTQCMVCGANAVKTLLNFGRHPLCNRYLNSANEPEVLFDFVLDQCSACGLVQFNNPISPAELKAPYDWISYNEQEGHLDHLVEKVIQLPNVSVASSVGAISYKDDSTVARFQKRGFENTWRLDLEKDLAISDRLAGLETIQQALTLQKAREIVAQRGAVDILIVRHILEHAHHPNAFSDALKAMVKPGGYLVFEVPDCEPALRRKDYSMPWEEHIAYFTPTTFQETLQKLGFSIVHYHSYVYANENSLIAIAQAAPKVATGNSSALSQSLELAGNYAKAFVAYKEAVRQALSAEQTGNRKVAVFGAGHLSCFWINALEVGQAVEFVVDDHPKKKGMFMPGSKLPIRGSTALIEENIGLCLLSLSPESEAKVVQKNQTFVEGGGKFLTIFPGKPNSLVAG